jgi:hypothetical protein
MVWRVELTTRLPFHHDGQTLRSMKAAEIIAEIKGLPPEGYAEVSAFMLKVEQDDPTLQVALQRKQDSLSGQGTSRPYQEAIASVRAGLAGPHVRRPAKRS